MTAYTFYSVDNSNIATMGEGEYPRIRFVNMQGHTWFELTDFTLNDWKQTWNQPDSASFTISPLHPAAKYIPLRTRDFECKIDVPEQNEPIWGEIVSVKGGPEGITFQVEGHLGMFANRFIDRSSLEFDSVPQTDIMEALINYAQDETHQNFRDLRILPRTLDLGTIWERPRSRQYFREEHENILDALHEFQTVDTPIDMRMSYVTDNVFGPGNWTRFLDIIPRYDMVYPFASPLTYSNDNQPDTILSFSWSEDTSTMANDIYAGGGSSGDIRFEGHYTSQSSAQKHGVITAMLSAGSMTDPDWLHSRAQSEVDQRKRSMQKLTVQAVTTGTGVGRLAWVGTIWPVKIDYGRISVDDNFRIISRSWSESRIVTLELERMTTPIIPPGQIFV